MRASGREKERGMLWEVREGRGGCRQRERERESARMIERRISKQMVAK